MEPSGWMTATLYKIARVGYSLVVICIYLQYMFIPVSRRVVRLLSLPPLHQGSFALQIQARPARQSIVKTVLPTVRHRLRS